jgi:nitroalkane oxidase
MTMSTEAASAAAPSGSEILSRSNRRRVVGSDSYDHEAPLGRLLQDALALPIFDGGNLGARRRQLHTMFKQSN